MKWIDIPPVWLFAALAVAGLESRVWVGLPRATFPLLTSIGTILFWIGIALILIPAQQMWRAGTTPVPHQEANKLVTTGLFRVSRNPIYLGDLCVLAGCCLRWEAWLSLALVPVLANIITRRFIVVEEARLAAKFGAAFDAYCARTRRWI